MKAVAGKKSGARWENDATYGILYHLLSAAAGFAFARAPVLGSFFPFGVAFTGGIKQKYLISSSVGACLGYLINLGSGFSGIAAVLAVIAVRFILSGAGKFSRSPAFSAIITFITVFITGMAVTLTYNTENVIGRICEALISAAAAYFVCLSGRISITDSTGLDMAEVVSVIFVSAIVLSSLFFVSIAGISIGKILAVTLILFAARYGQSSYGAIGGAAVSLTAVISAGAFEPYAAIYTFCGLMAGVFSKTGSVMTVLAYIVTTAVISFITGDANDAFKIILSAIIGGGIFLIIPQKTGNFLNGVFSAKSEISRPDTIKGELIMRLEFASGALKDVFEMVEDVAKRLKSINCPDFEKTLTEIEQDTCGGCSLRKHCWETERQRTAADTVKIWAAVKAQKYGEETASEIAEPNCLRSEALKKSIGARLSELDSKKAAEQRISEVRNVISDQFEGISEMLYDLSEEFKYEVRHDGKSAETIIFAMKDLGYHSVNCIAARDKFGRLSADIRVKGAADKFPNKMQILHHLSSSLGIELDTPSVSYGGDEAFISITEKPVYKIEIGISQISQTEGKLCGDNCRYFCDGRGRMILLLSDGMGTGGRAAVDSAMVSGLMGRMLRSGFGYDCSLKIINSSMIFKSTDESLATVDITSIDLFNGKCELLKAGAAPTLIRQNGKMGCAESRSLPPGILRDVRFDRAEVKLKNDDIIVMMSDGAATNGTNWISSVISAWDAGSAQQLSDAIANAARRRRDDGHNDDISVMTAILKRRL